MQAVARLRGGRALVPLARRAAPRAAARRALSSGGAAFEAVQTLAMSPIEGTVPEWRSPIYMVQSALDAAHERFELPWWLTVAASTLVVKALLLPIYARSQRSIAANSHARPELEKLQQMYTAEQKANNPQAAADFKARLAAVFAKHDCHPLGALGWGMLQAPAFVTFFMCLRSLHQRFEGLETGGVLWFEDLAMPDGTYMLPVLSGTLMLVHIEITSRDMGPMKTTMQRTMRWLGRGMCFMVVPFSGFLPSTVMIYWVCNSAITLAQSVAFRTRPVQRLFGVREKLLPPDSPAAMAQARRAAAAGKEAGAGEGAAPPKVVEIPKTFASKPPKKMPTK